MEARDSSQYLAAMMSMLRLFAQLLWSSEIQLFDDKVLEHIDLGPQPWSGRGRGRGRPKTQENVEEIKFSLKSQSVPPGTMHWILRGNAAQLWS